jgi:hypothetical protein
MTPDNELADEWQIGKDLEESGHGLIKTLSTEGLRQIMKDLSQDILCPVRDSKLSPLR